MSGKGSITLQWADGEHTFRLGIGELREHQERTGAGPMAVWRRLMSGTWTVDDIRETLRLGLIGGGMQPARALAKVVRYVEDAPIAPNVVPAVKVLSAALFGDPNDLVGKIEAADEPDAATTTQTTGSNSQNLSEAAPLWDGRSTTLTEPAYGNSPPLAMAGNGVIARTKPNPSE